MRACQGRDRALIHRTMPFTSVVFAGVNPHKDAGFLTILSQDSVAALQVSAMSSAPGDQSAAASRPWAYIECSHRRRPKSSFREMDMRTVHRLRFRMGRLPPRSMAHGRVAEELTRPHHCMVH